MVSLQQDIVTLEQHSPTVKCDGADEIFFVFVTAKLKYTSMIHDDIKYYTENSDFQFSWGISYWLFFPVQHGIAF